MTTGSDFKHLVRRQMARSGLSYQAARRSLLALRSEENDVNNESNAYRSDAVRGPAGPTVTLAAIRQRPERFIVNTGAAGIEHLCLEVVANSVDEFNAGHATNVAVAVGDDGSIFVRDDGRGIPVEPSSAGRRSALEMAFLQPGAGAKGVGGGYGASAGASGLGLSVVTAVSSRVRVWVERDGQRYEAEFASTDDEPGRVVKPVTETGGAGLGRSTAVQFWPDPKIFGDATVDVDHLTERLGLLAAVSDSLVITLSAQGSAPRLVGSPGRIGCLLEASSTTTRRVVRRDGRALVAITPTEGDPRVVRSFVNGIETIGGDHVDAALASAPAGAWAMVVSVWVRQPSFQEVATGYVIRSDTARDLVTAAITSPEAMAS
jgi:DNA gyrase/topoisomerase IV subunit B